MKKLLKWALSQGAHVNKLAGSIEDPREFVATEDIGPGDTLITLPQQLLMHAGFAYRDEEFGGAFRVLESEGAGKDPRNVLCLLLLLERTRGAASKWAPYVDILPKQYDDPFWWSEDEVQLLRGTRLGRAVQQHSPGLLQLEAWILRLDEIQRSLRPNAPPSTLSTYLNGWALTHAAVLWARSTVWSRSFTIHRLAHAATDDQLQQQQQPGVGLQQQQQPGEGLQQQQQPGEKVIALVPVLDMIDHNPEIEAIWHTGADGRDDFTFAPLTPFQKGQAVRNNYGCKTNDELILAYGFAIPNNPADYFHVSIGHGNGVADGGMEQRGSLAHLSASAAPPRVSETRSLVMGSERKQHQATGLNCSTALTPPSSTPPAVEMLQNGSRNDAAEHSMHAGPAASDPHAGRTPGGSSGGGGHGGGGSGGGPSGGAVSALSMQQAAEEMQRQKILALLNLPLEHHLTMQQPLPQALVLSTQACLLPPPELYLTSSKLLGDASRALNEQQQRAGDLDASTAAAAVLEWPQQPTASHHSLPPASPPPVASAYVKRNLEELNSGGAQGATASADMPMPMSPPCPAPNSELPPPRQQYIPPAAASSGGSQGPCPGSSSQHATAAPLLLSPPLTLLLSPAAALYRSHLPSTAVHVLPNGNGDSSGGASSSEGSRPWRSSGKDACILLGCGSNVNKALFNARGCVFCGNERLGGLNIRLPHDLRVLVALRQQLESKLDGMVSASDLAQLESKAPSGGGGGGGDGTHGHLVLSYVRGQQRIVLNSLAVLQCTISKVLHAAASTATSDASHHGWSPHPLSNSTSHAGATASVVAAASGGSATRALKEQSLRSVLDYVFPSAEVLQTPSEAAAAPARACISCQEDGDRAGGSWLEAGGGPSGIGGAADGTASGSRPKAAETEPDMGTTDMVSHMQAYSEWLASRGIQLPHQRQPPPLEPGAAPPCPSPCCLTEVITRMRPSALSSSAEPSGKGSSKHSSFRAQKRSACAAALHAELSSLPSNLATKARAMLPSGISCSFGLEQEHDPVSWGADVTESAAAGSMLVQVPSDCAIISTSKEALVHRLMVPAYRLLQVLIANTTRSLGISDEAVAFMMTGRKRVTNKELLAKCGVSSTSGTSAGSRTSAWSQQCSGEMQAPSDMLVLHLLHTVGAGAPARLAVSESDGMRMVFEMLEDSPSGATYDEVFSTLEEDFSQLKASVSASVPAPPAPATATSSFQAASSHGAEHQPPSESEIACALNWSGGFGLYCWAVEAVNRCAVQVQRGASRGALWAIIPVVCAIPAELKDAVLRVSLQEAAVQKLPLAGGSCSEAADSGPQASCNTQTHVLDVHAACHLTAGLPLTPSVLLRWMDCDSMLATYGPEALAWHRLITLTMSGDPPSPATGGGSDIATAAGPSTTSFSPPGAPGTSRTADGSGTADATPADVPSTSQGKQEGAPAPFVGSSGTAPDASQGQQPNRKRRLAPATTSRLLGYTPVPVGNKPAEPSTIPNPKCNPNASGAPTRCDAQASNNYVLDADSPRPGLLLYELYIAPSETDPLHMKKMEVLVAAGLGTVHYLTAELETRTSIVSALRICFADADFLMGPSVMRLTRLHAATEKSMAAGTGDEDDASACGASPMLGSSLDNATQGPDNGQGGEQLQQMHQAQLQLVNMLTALADDHTVSQAARRQLRHLISDARKYAKRRLRQMDAMKASASVGPRLCGGVTPAVRIGVRCYLQAIAHVLDIWSEHLGLNQTSGHSGASSGRLASSVPTLGTAGDDSSCDLLKKRSKLS